MSPARDPVENTHKEESRADDLRREIEQEMYSKALIPESRGDILGILESVDRVLSLAEQVLFDVQYQMVEVPSDIKDGLSKLADLVGAATTSVDAAVRLLLAGIGRAQDVSGPAEQIDRVESESDHLERALIRTIFESSMETGKKILLRDIVRQLGAMCDACEAVADRLTIVSVKRRV